MKNLFKIGFAMMLLFMGIATSCSSDDDDVVRKVEAVDIDLTPSTRAVAKTLEPTYVNYTAEMIKYSLSSQQPQPNLATSPVSAAMLLAMIANGTEEQSRKEIIDYLGVDDLDALNELILSLMEGLPKTDAHVDINLANSLWTNKAWGISPDITFLTEIEKYYKAKSFNYDFIKNNNGFLKELKKWYSKNTDGMITDPEKTLRPDANTVAIILNALYFKAPWNHFPEENTKKAVFHGANYEEMVEMMTSYELKDRYYYKDEEFEVMSINFANSAYWLNIVLPAEGKSLSDAVELLTPEFIETVKDEKVKCDLTISLPKFSINSSFKLNQMLMRNGVSGFMNGQNLTMFDKQLGEGFGMEVMQNTAFSIDEEGVKVASVSSGKDVAMDNVAFPGEKYTVVVDRPFFFYIVERSTQAWITSGYVGNIE